MFESSLYNKLYNINQERMQKITVNNIRAGVNIFGTVGNYTSDANAQASDIANGKTAYVNGSKISGGLKEYNNTNSMPIYNINLDVVNSNLNAQFNNRVFVNGDWRVFPEGIVRNGTNITIPYNVITNKIGLNPTDIKKDVKVFDITGTYDASTEFEGIKMDPVVASSTAISLTKSISEISGLDTTNGTNMHGFFSGLGGLISVSNLDLTNVTTLNFLFQNDYKLSTLKFINMYNSEVTNIPMSSTFANCYALTNIDETIKMPKVINQAYYTFFNCHNLTDINTDMNIKTNICDGMFYNCVALQDISNVHFFSPGTGVSTVNMFQNCKKLNFETLNLQGINLNNPTSMFGQSNICSASLVENMFNNLSSLNLRSYMFDNTNIDRAPHIENFEHVLTNSYSTQAHGFDYAFTSCPNLIEGDINIANFRWCTAFRYTFYNCTNLTSSNINLYNNWKVTNQYNAYNFQQTYLNCPNLTDVNITCDNSTFYFQGTFANCTNLVSVKMPTNWNIANSVFSGVFLNCYNITNLDSIIDYVTSVNNMALYNAFANCTKLNYDKEIILNTYSPSFVMQVFGNCPNVTNNITLNIQNHSKNSLVNANYFVSGAGFNSANIWLNYSNLTNSYYGVYVSNCIINCSNLKTVNIDIALNSVQQNPSRKVGFYRIIENCPNITDVNYNFKIYNDYTWPYAEESLFINCPNLTNLSVNIVYGKVNNASITAGGANYSNICRIVTNCNNITTFNFNANISSNMFNFGIARNCPNLSDINYNITFGSGFNYMHNAPLFVNCPNLSDNLIDNLLGTINNIPEYKGTKKLSMVFNNCNISDVRYESLNNYAGLIAKGWTIN